MLNIQKKMSNAFFALLSLPSTAMGFALSVQISALSWILSTKYGLAIHEIGIVWAAGPIAGIIAQPIVGAISDKLWFMGGRRRPWIVLGGTLAALMLLALPNLEVIQKIIVGGSDPQAGLLTIAIVVALTLDLSINVSFNPTRSLVADCTPLSERSKGFTWMQTISGSFGVLAYLIGGTLGNIFLIYFGVGVAFLASVIPAFLIEEPRELKNFDAETQSPKSKTTFRELWEAMLPLSGFLLYGIYVIFSKLGGFELKPTIPLFGYYLNVIEFLSILLLLVSAIAVLLNLFKSGKKSNEFQKVLLAHSFTWIGVQTMFIYALFYLKDVLQLADNAGSVNSIAFFVLSLVSAVLPVLVLNRLAEKYGMVKTHLSCIFIMALGYASILFFGHSVAVYYFLIAIVGIGWGSVVSLPFAIMSEKVDQTKMGLYMGIFNLAVVLPQLVASFKMGEVINAAPNKSVIFAICAITLFISGILWLFVKNEK
ncbi:MAG TPA: MFS transporter [Paludibacteraceae bacterium]|nr:MFS transporter [Paludibacteraceae bacterium]HPQ12858.1 MFS transporter [Paludibacteraceae bacterium]